MTQPFLSIIVPVYNGQTTLVDCLRAIIHSSYQNWELIVVDDGSTDASANLAEQMGAIVIRAPGRKGPAAARNLGAQVAIGKYLCFIDADCEVLPNTLERFAQVLRSNSTIDALFGSYDDAPKAINFVAQYRNLLHHYIHQTSREQASTFWSGCGVIKRSIFLRLGGFNVHRYPRPSIEDIDLGYRLRQLGGEIRLVKDAQVKHHKAWNFTGMLKTDVFDRAIPWTLLLQEYESAFTNDLNLQFSSRLSVVLIYILIFSLLASFYSFSVVGILLLSTILLLTLNVNLYLFFYQKRGKKLGLKAILMHWFYYFYSGAAFLIGCSIYWINSLKRKPLFQTTLNS